MTWSIIWFDSRGVMVDLTGPPYVMTVWTSLTGSMTPEYRFVTERTPLKDGQQLKYIDVESREVDLIVLVRGSGEANLWNRINFLSNFFNPRQGPGRLRVRTPTGVTRELVCYPSSGFRVSESSMTRTSAELHLTFLAIGPPYWRSTSQTVKTFRLDDNPPHWFPLPPITLGGDAISSTFYLDNFGHVPTQPVWKITGPGSDPKITNEKTGEYISLTNNGGITLDDGQFIVIDTAQKTVTLNDGTNLMSRVDWGSSFFEIPNNGVFEEGTLIKVEMGEVTDESIIEVRYYTYFLGVG